MSLSDIKRKLYQKDEDKDLSRHSESEFNPEVNKPAPVAAPGEDAWTRKIDPDLEQKKQRSIRKGAIAFGIIISVIVVITGLMLYRKISFSEDRVVVQIQGPSSAGSGKLLTYNITYDNNNRAELSNAVLRVSFPENFQPEENPNFISDGPTSGHWDIGAIEGHGKGKLVFNGRVYSPQGALIYLKTEMRYTPSVFSSVFVSKNQLGINITSTPITLEVMAPQNISTGDAVNYLISYKNNGSQDFENLKIKADYPSGFTFTKSDPQSLEADNIWYIGRVAPGQQGKITVSGKLEGNRDEMKTLKVYVGSVENGNFAVYSEEDADTRITSSPLAISQTVNDLMNLSADPNQLLSFVINFRNEGVIGLRDVIITEDINSDALDYSTIQTNGGTFDAGAKTITWKASDTPVLRVLEPGASGSVRFSVKVKDIVPISAATDKNFVISSVAKIDSPDVPTPINLNKTVAGNKIDVRLNTKLILTVNGFYTDPNIPNTGPIPPKVDQETTYTIHWALTDTTNDLTGVKVESVLPTGAVMTGKKFPDTANITYNQRNNSVIWDVGNLSAGTGILTGAKEVSFQVMIKPSANQVNQEVGILGESTAEGKDYFTGNTIQAKVDPKTTYLREDATIVPGVGTRVSN